MKENALLLFLLMIVSFFSLTTGEISITSGEIIQSLWKADSLNEIQKPVLMSLRIPRLLSGLLCGGTLALCGLIFQSVLKNPLAEPYLLGISSGGGLFYIIGILSGSAGFLQLSFWTFAGCLLALFSVTFLAGKFQGDFGTGMILSGVISGAFFSACSSFLAFLNSRILPRVQTWMLGHLEVYDYTILAGLAILLFLVFIYLWMKSSTLDILLLGEEHAYHMGISVKKEIWKILFVTSILVSYTVSCFGMIGFIGLIIPHTVRKWKPGIHQKLLIPVLLSGGLILSSVDLMIRFYAPASNIPVGLLTVIAGAPFFLYQFFNYSVREQQ